MCPACTPQRVNRQTELKNVVWKSEVDNFGFILEFTVLDDNARHFGILDYDDQLIDIAFTWGNGSFDIRAVNYYGQIIGGTDYIGGGYSIIDDSSVEIEILIDSIFDGALIDKKITLTATTIDGTSYGAFERHEVCWQTDDKSLSVYVYQGCRRFGIGEYIVGEDKYKIVLYLLEDLSFTVYEMDGDNQTEKILLSGTYTSEGYSLTLNCYGDNVSVIELSGRNIENNEFPQQIWYPA